MEHGDGRGSCLRSFEIIGGDDLTEPVEIWPCKSCSSWHVEVYRREDGRGGVREWHDENCRHLLSVLQEFEADGVA
jgi:hypothetical protein